MAKIKGRAIIADLDLTEVTVKIKCGDCDKETEKTLHKEELGPPLVKCCDVYIAPGPCISCVQANEGV